MTVTVEYFAVLREQSGLKGETVDTSSKTWAGLYSELAGRHGFTLPPALVRPAVGTTFRQMDDPVEDGATVVFIPPVAGG